MILKERQKKQLKFKEIVLIQQLFCAFHKCQAVQQLPKESKGTVESTTII